MNAANVFCFFLLIVSVESVRSTFAIFIELMSVHAVNIDDVAGICKRLSAHTLLIVSWRATCDNRTTTSTPFEWRTIFIGKWNSSLNKYKANGDVRFVELCFRFVVREFSRFYFSHAKPKLTAAEPKLDNIYCERREKCLPSFVWFIFHRAQNANPRPK